MEKITIEELTYQKAWLKKHGKFTLPWFDCAPTFPAEWVSHGGISIKSMSSKPVPDLYKKVHNLLYAQVELLEEFKKA